MKICATYGAAVDSPFPADMQEVRLDVFDAVPSWADANTVVTAAGKDRISLPDGFDGIVDVGDRDVYVPCRKIRSFHHFDGTPPAPFLMMEMGSGDQWISKCACMVNSFRDLHTLYRVADTIGRRHVVIGMGQAGTVTRIRSDLLHNEFTFGYVGKSTAPGQLSAEEMLELGDCEIVGITGTPLAHSRSPAMQEAAMRKAGIRGRYLVFESPDVENMADVMREYDIRGLNVTIPHKTSVMGQLDSVEEAAHDIGAVNTVVNDNGKIVGYNTDVMGIEYAFERSGRPLGDHEKVLVHGTGGAARAAVWTAISQGCSVGVMGRTREHVDALCRD